MICNIIFLIPNGEKKKKKNLTVYLGAFKHSTKHKKLIHIYSFTEAFLTNKQQGRGHIQKNPSWYGETTFEGLWCIFFKWRNPLRNEQQWCQRVSKSWKRIYTLVCIYTPPLFWGWWQASFQMITKIHLPNCIEFSGGSLTALSFFPLISTWNKTRALEFCPCFEELEVKAFAPCYY